MITTERRMRGAGFWLAGCVLMSWTMFGASPAAAEDVAKTTTNANALVEAMTRPGPPGLLTKGYFDNNPGCVSAKLDIWFTRGHHTHQLFTAHAEENPRLLPQPGERPPNSRQTGEGDKANTAFHDVIDADRTTIFVGGDGCRFRVRIDRAE